jgi:hypothetical protein
MIYRFDISKNIIKLRNDDKNSNISKRTFIWINHDILRIRIMIYQMRCHDKCPQYIIICHLIYHFNIS